MKLEVKSGSPNAVTIRSEDSFALEAVSAATQEKWEGLGLVDWHFAYEGTRTHGDREVTTYRFHARFSPASMLGIYIQWLLGEWMNEIRREKLVQIFQNAEEDLHEALREKREE